MRILLHPGFHKTGTSSLQRGAEARMRALAPYLRLMVTADVIDAARAARRYSARPDKVSLHRFTDAFAQALAPLDPADTRALLISSEDLSGYIPGHHEVWSYAAAPALAEAAVNAMHRHFGGAAEITLLFTTRAALPWQRSVYWQNLRALRLTEDFERYRPRLEAAARLNDVVTAVSDRLAARARVRPIAIEECRALPLGPLGAALELLDLPTDGLEPLPAWNVQPDGASDELLALNRSELDDAALAKAKRAVLKRHRKSGRTRRDAGDNA